MSIYNLFDTNEELEKDGFTLELVEGDTKISFTIARAGGANKKFTKRIQKLLKPHQLAFDRGQLDEKIQDKIFVRAISEHIVLDWDGIEDRDGNPLEFNVENCIWLLTEIPELRKQIYKESEDISNFIYMERVESSKNSQTSTSGNSVEVPKPTKSKKQQSKEE